MFIASLRLGLLRIAAAVIGGLTLAAALPAQIALGAGTYAQDFNTPAAALPTGWLFAEAGTNANTAFASGTGSSNAGDTYFLGVANDWAFGGLQSGSLVPTVGVAFTNNTGAPITSLTVSYTGETWRIGATARADRLDFQYSVDATSLTTGTWINVDALDYANVAAAATASGSMLHSAVITSTISGLSIAPGATFYLRWTDFNAAGSDDAMGVDNFTISSGGGGGPVQPSITTPPASQTVTEGATVQFTVVAGGTAPFTYQWRKGTTPLGNTGIITGALSDTLTLTGVALADAGSYDVVVTNAGGSATSAAATLTVNPTLLPPAITSQPVSQSAPAGGSASFSVGVSGTAPFTYQWRKAGTPLADGGNISGATGPLLTINPVGAGDVGSYDVVVSNAVSPAATSNAAALSLAALVTPAGHIAYVGGSYLQSFDTLPSGGSFTLAGEGPLAFTDAPISASGLGGWSLAKYDGTGAVALFRVDAGTSTSGGINSYGSAAAGDRALGSLSSGSTVSRFGAVLTNGTGRTITEFTLSYTGEQWRRGTAAANTLAFEYALGGSDINNGAFVAAPALSFTAPVTTGSGALNGNLAANRTAVSATVTGLTWAPGQTLVLRWTDVDDSGGDDGLAVDDLSFSTPVGPGDILPAVIYTTPANGSVNVATNTAVSVTFNEAVNFTTSSFTLAGAVSGPSAASVSGGPVSYTLTPAAPFAGGESVTLAIAAAQVTDAATGTRHPGGDFSTSFFTFSTAPLPIHVVQGAGTASPFAGYPVTVQGVVVASFQAPGQIGGYYVEAPDAAHDADPATSEGIYVFDNANSVAVGDLVTITGTVTEYGSAPMSQTEIASVTAFTKVGSGQPLPTPVPVTLPFPAAGYAERYEGMLVTLPQSLAVTDNYDLGRFGEVVLSNGVLPIPTNIVAPGAPAQAQAAANRLNQIVLDDGLSTLNPSPTPYLNSADPAVATRRAGSTATGVTGILDNKFGLYVIEPTAAPVFVDANPRAPAPAVGGRLRVAIGNVLNFFNGDGAGGGFPTSRGATNFAEYQRQRAKIVAGITALAPDIMGLTEVENDGFGPLSAIADLVNGLNAAAPAGTTYAYVDGTGVEITTDVIHVAFIYRQETVELVGAPAMLSHPAFNNLARNPLAQTFREKSTSGKFTVCVNHFRAKASVAPGPGNADAGDGQGNNNALRVQQSNALTAWLATDPTGSGDPDFLVIGDLNAYAKEDPIVAIENAGYANLTELFEGAGGYSYAFNGEFGHLDHALANAALTAQVAGAATWHVNSDEPVYYDYNAEDKDAAQLAVNAGTAYRYSDHDPVVVGINLTAPPVITTQPAAQTVTVGNPVTFTVVATGVPAPTYQWRFNGTPIGGATSASLTLPLPLTASAGSYDVVVTNAAGSVTSAPAVLTVNKGTAAVTLAGLAQTYAAAPRVATATTVPAGLAVQFTYDGSATPPVNVGSYAVVATVNDANYTGTAAGTLVVSKATASIIFGGLNQTYDGTPRVVTTGTVPAGLAVQLTYNGSAAAPVNAGSYAVAATINDANYTGAATGTLVVAPATAAVTLGNLSQVYDGTPKAATVTTTPAGLNVTLTYDNSPVAPTNPGTYAVVATVNEPNYTGSASGTLRIEIAALVRRLGSLNGGIHGSIQVTTADAVTLNGGAWISGNLLVPGTPEVRLNGKPVYGGTNDGTGAASPSNYTVTLNGNSTLQHVVRRTDPLALPVVTAPPAPAGTRDVSLNSAGQSPGDFATLRNLTLNGNAGSVAVPAGTYGRLTANGNSSLVLGVAGSTAPAVYNLQGLTLNGNSQVQVVGPVILNLAEGITLNGNMGNAGHPEWLELNVASGGVTLNGNIVLDGYVTAPSGTIVINGNSVLNGGVTADRLTINGKGALIEVD